MKLERLATERLDEFKAYCRKHKNDGIDDSFLYEEDLEGFTPDEENPTYVLLDANGTVAGAASLIMDDYQKRGKRARFRIFHSEVQEPTAMKQLFQAVVPHAEGLEKLVLFVPLVNRQLMEAVEVLGFETERISYLLVRDVSNIPAYTLPERYGLRSFQQGTDEEAWCEVRNTAFAHLQGSETPITPEMVKKMTAESDYLEGGMILLTYEGKAVGIVRGADDEYEDAPIMNIGPVAILPEHQGKGLGRILLRAALEFARAHSYNRTILCVNGENDRAKALYLQEGFRDAEGAVCYKYRLNRS